MQLFYAPDLDFQQGTYTFDQEESKHCVRVLRLISGSPLCLTDGRGTMVWAQVEDASPKRCRVRLCERAGEFEKRGYELWMGVAPTKNMDRLEWFVEKATEIGVDRITPLLTDHSERKVVKSDRLTKVATSAMKQSLKAYHPHIDELTPFKEWVSQPFDGVRLIAHCEKDQPRRLLKELLRPGERVMVLIGPEGDFSPEEITFAREHGFVDLSLGRSRLRTETAAVVAVHSVSFINEL